MPRILVIDDDVNLRRAVTAILRRAGHEVEEASTGSEAMRLFEEEPAAVVVTDINMPEMDGIEVIMALQKLRPSVPIIAMSGGGLMPQELLLKNAKILGAVTTLAKPFESAELLESVQVALDGIPASDDSPDA